MIGELKPYGDTKDSGVPWLGQVPAHWVLRRMKSAVANVVDQTSDMEPDQVYVALEHVESWTGRARPQRDRGLFTGYVKRFREGDVLFGKLRPYLAKVTRIAGAGVCAGEFFVLRPTDPDLTSSYLEHLLRAKQTIDVIDGSTFGAKMPRADWQFCGSLPIPLPPPAEQAAIVRFLDWANGRLERAIRAKRKVIALLGEQKQAIIHRAVTRGLDPNVRLKSSGIPWLGDIPAHWEVRQLRHLGRLFKGVGGSKEDATLSGVPCVRYGELYFHYRNWIRQPRGFISRSRATAYSPIRFGDVLFAASGERVEEIGKSAVNLYDGQIVCGGDIVIFRPTATVHAPFLGYSLDDFGAAWQKATMCRGTTIKHIYPDELRGLWMCLPPLEEQERIATALESALAGTDTAISRLTREINLLREYRTRLVADVVTGKLDVREVAASLPDETPIDAIECDPNLTDDLDIADEKAVVA